MAMVYVPIINDLKEYCEFAETIAKEQKEFSALNRRSQMKSHTWDGTVVRGLWRKPLVYSTAKMV